MRAVLILVLFCLCRLPIAGLKAQDKAPKATPPDTASTLEFNLHPGAVGGTFSGGEANSGVLFRGSISAHGHAQKWDGTIALDLMQGAGPTMLRALEAGYDSRFGKGRMARRFRARWDWHPLPSVHLALGRDTLHDGWGRRSLFRGRHAAPVPFLQTELNSGGRLRYRHRIEALQGAPSFYCSTDNAGDPRTWIPPTGTMRTGIERMVVSHRLEVDFGQRITGALWGAVVWNVNGGQRRFEPHYLLPLTSIRPTEYAQGSSDNALVGLEGKLRLGKTTNKQQRFLYGQLLLDELIVEEILGSTGWWGNKYGMLGGICWTYPRGAWRAELSGVRPWTYSHYTPTSAYLNGLTPLAHPLGANFLEGSVAVQAQRGKWNFHSRLTASTRGDNPLGDAPTGSLPQVGDIDRQAETYLWLNGTARSLLLLQIDAARPINFSGLSSVQAFVRGEFRRLDAGESAEIQPFFVLGLRTTGPWLGADW